MPPPPDLSSYRLSEQDSHRIFTTEILPVEFHDFPSQPSPPSTTAVGHHHHHHHHQQRQALAVLVVGQTGAGKTRLSPAILSGMRLVNVSQPPVHLIADTYKTYHPSYAHLMETAPQHASPATGPDARKWLAMASEEVTRRRLNVLLESACRHPSDFKDLVRIFSAAGYRVEIVLLAVPAALSMLGIQLRYHEKLPEAQSRNLPVRLTPAKVHDDSYAGLMDAAAFLDQSALADQVLVVRRGNMVAYGVSKTSDGKMDVGETTIAAALARERHRPLTPEEAQTASADLQKLGDYEDGSNVVERVKGMLQSVVSDTTDQDESIHDWPVLKPLRFAEADSEAGDSFNVLRLGYL
ncbi:zeta toxin family protein [Moelleriella libera RCEF 2490]|uniref:Zeta toxin family protein n=1 Tax=Moelleriella libera RCEF 2490 TaxID=1081109 RepID=A0A166U474_9HYPO|nr:zeta toxin family protein [Moelleriella libera RCEF 2490]